MIFLIVLYVKLIMDLLDFSLQREKKTKKPQNHYLLNIHQN